MNSVIEMLQELRVFHDPALAKIRLGNKHDGGYVVYEELCKKTSHCFSFGVGNDISFETALHKLNPSTCFRLYDPTISASAVLLMPPGFNFNKLGALQAYWRGDLNFATENSLLKVDIEWNEWELLKEMNPLTLSSFGQIVIELHFLHVGVPRNDLSPYFQGFYQGALSHINRDLFGEYVKTIKKLTEHFYIYHAHVNNSLPESKLHLYSFPPLLELSLARKDLAPNSIEFKGPFPLLDLDSPNKTDRPDYPFKPFIPFGDLANVSN